MYIEPGVIAIGLYISDSLKFLSEMTVELFKKDEIPLQTEEEAKQIAMNEEKYGDALERELQFALSQSHDVPDAVIVFDKKIDFAPNANLAKVQVFIII